MSFPPRICVRGKLRRESSLSEADARLLALDSNSVAGMAFCGSDAIGLKDCEAHNAEAILDCFATLAMTAREALAPAGIDRAA